MSKVSSLSLDRQDEIDAVNAYGVGESISVYWYAEDREYKISKYGVGESISVDWYAANAEGVDDEEISLEFGDPISVDWYAEDLYDKLKIKLHRDFITYPNGI